MGPLLAAAPADGFSVPPVGADDLAHVVGDNLRRLRTRRGLSLDRLAKASGVSRAMLGQIELGRSVPTISVLWKIARTLNVPFSTFTTAQAVQDVTVIRLDRSKILSSRDGRFSSRALFPFDPGRKVEFYELKLLSGGREEAEPHQPGTIENIAVVQGGLSIVVGNATHRLAPGDSIQFAADQPHAYFNAGESDALAYLVMIYAEEIG